MGTPNKKGNILKITELGLDKRLFEAMRDPGFSAESFSRKLATEEIKISPQSIRKFIRKSKKAQQELIQSDLQVAEQFKQLAMDYGKAIKEILKEVEGVKNTAKDEKDLATYNQLVGRLYQGIELIAKLTGDIKPAGSIDINIIYNEISSDMEKKMKHMKTELFKNVVDIDAKIIEDDKKSAENLLKNEKK